MDLDIDIQIEDEVLGDGYDAGGYEPGATSQDRAAGGGTNAEEARAQLDGSELLRAGTPPPLKWVASTDVMQYVRLSDSILRRTRKGLSLVTVSRELTTKTTGDKAGRHAATSELPHDEAAIWGSAASGAGGSTLHRASPAANRPHSLVLSGVKECRASPMRTSGARAALPPWLQNVNTSGTAPREGVLHNVSTSNPCTESKALVMDSLYGSTSHASIGGALSAGDSVLQPPNESIEDECGGSDTLVAPTASELHASRSPPCAPHAYTHGARLFGATPAPHAHHGNWGAPARALAATPSRPRSSVLTPPRIQHAGLLAALPADGAAAHSRAPMGASAAKGVGGSLTLACSSRAKHAPTLVHAASPQRIPKEGEPNASIGRYSMPTSTVAKSRVVERREALERSALRGQVAATHMVNGQRTTGRLVDVTQRIVQFNEDSFVYIDATTDKSKFFTLPASQSASLQVSLPQTHGEAGSGAGTSGSCTATPPAVHGEDNADLSNRTSVIDAQSSHLSGTSTSHTLVIEEGSSTTSLAMPSWVLNIQHNAAAAPPPTEEDMRIALVNPGLLHAPHKFHVRGGVNEPPNSRAALKRVQTRVDKLRDKLSMLSIYQENGELKPEHRPAPPPSEEANAAYTLQVSSVKSPRGDGRKTAASSKSTSVLSWSPSPRPAATAHHPTAMSSSTKPVLRLDEAQAVGAAPTVNAHEAIGFQMDDDLDDVIDAHVRDDDSVASTPSVSLTRPPELLAPIHRPPSGLQRMLSSLRAPRSSDRGSAAATPLRPQLVTSRSQPDGWRGNRGAAAVSADSYDPKRVVAISHLKKALETVAAAAAREQRRLGVASEEGTEKHAMLPSVLPRTLFKDKASNGTASEPHTPIVAPDAGGHRRAGGFTGAVRARPQLTLQFVSTREAQLFYGSTVVLESLDGWYLTVHPRTGVVAVREPEPKWYLKGTMPFVRKRLLGGGTREVPLFMFKVMHLRNPLANGPVRFGDPVWLQVCQGRGEDGWRTGSVLAPYMHHAISLDAAAVDVQGQPLGFHDYTHQAQHDPDLAHMLEEASADNIMFGLPTNMSAASYALADVSINVPPESEHHDANSRCGGQEDGGGGRPARIARQPSLDVDDAAGALAAAATSSSQAQPPSKFKTASTGRSSPSQAASMLAASRNVSYELPGALPIDGAVRATLSFERTHLRPTHRRGVDFISPVGSAYVGDGTASEHDDCALHMASRGSMELFRSLAQGGGGGGGISSSSSSLVSAGNNNFVGSPAVGGSSSPTGSTFLTSLLEVPVSSASGHGSISPIPRTSSAGDGAPPPLPGLSAELSQTVTKISACRVPVSELTNSAEFLYGLRRDVTFNARANPLDRLRGKIGVPRPLAAHVPVPGSMQDFLYGPATVNSKNGLYYHDNPGYDVLYASINAQPLMAGKWRLQPAVKEVTEDGFIIGGLGIEGPVSDHNSAAAAIAALHGNGSGIDTNNLRVRRSKPPAMHQHKTRREGLLLASPEDVQREEKKKEGSDDEREDAEQRMHAAARDAENDFVRDVIHNFEEVYLEHDWFYVAFEASTADAEQDATVLAYEGNAFHADAAEVESADDGDGGSVKGSRSRSGSIVEGQLPSHASLPTIIEEVADKEVDASHMLNGKAAIPLAHDSSAYVPQRPDGLCGGNRRHTFLQAHEVGLHGNYKVQRRGIFRLRIVQTHERGVSGMPDRDEELGLRARTQLAESEKIRLGASAAALREISLYSSSVASVSGSAPASSVGDGEWVDRHDKAAAANLARNLRAARKEIDEEASRKYLAHEALKFTLPQAYYDKRLTAAQRRLHAEAAEVLQQADRAGQARLKELHAAGPPRRRTTNAKQGRAANEGHNVSAPGGGAGTDSARTVGGPTYETGTGGSAHARDEPCKLCAGIQGRPIFSVHLCAEATALQQVVDAEAVREAGENRSASAIGVTTGSQPASRGREQSGTFHTQGSDASRRASAWAVASGSVPDAGTGGGAPSVGRTPSVKSVATASHASELGGEHSTRVASIAGMTARRKDSGGVVPVAGSPQRGLQFNFHGLHVSMDDDDEPSGVERMAAVWERTALGADGFRSTMQTEDATLLRVVHYDWEHGQHRRATQLHYGGGLGGHFSGLRRRIRHRADEGDNMSNTPTSSRPTTPTRTATVLSEPAHAVGTPGSAGAARTGTRGSHRSVPSRRSLPSAAVREAMDLL